MKLLFASDLHGSATACQKILNLYETERADQLILLGDLLYHGPRNPLPEGYAPMEVARLLNVAKRELLSVRGNCDAEVDQMVLEFPLAESLWLYIDDHRAFVTHGHLHMPEQLAALLRPGDLYVQGHTHVAAAQPRDGYVYLNPGSVALPKDRSASYMVYEDGCFFVKDLEKHELLSFALA